MSQDTVLKEIRTERERQDGLWGTEFDDRNTLNDWVTYITIYASQAARMDAPPEDQRKNMMKTATLAVAAIQSFDRNGRFAPRHYEDKVPVDIVDKRRHGLGPIEHTSLRDEIIIIRMAIEQLMNGVETTDDLVQRSKSLCELMRTMERLVGAAVDLEHQVAKSEKPR